MPMQTNPVLYVGFSLLNPNVSYFSLITLSILPITEKIFNKRPEFDF